MAAAKENELRRGRGWSLDVIARHADVWFLVRHGLLTRLRGGRLLVGLHAHVLSRAQPSSCSGRSACAYAAGRRGARPEWVRTEPIHLKNIPTKQPFVVRVQRSLLSLQRTASFICPMTHPSHYSRLAPRSAPATWGHPRGAYGAGCFAVWILLRAPAHGFGTDRSLPTAKTSATSPVAPTWRND